jgi:hypothetical protein
MWSFPEKACPPCIPRSIPFLSTPQEVQTFGLSPLQRRYDVVAEANYVHAIAQQRHLLQRRPSEEDETKLVEDLCGPCEVEWVIR